MIKYQENFHLIEGNYILKLNGKKYSYPVSLYSMTRCHMCNEALISPKNQQKEALALHINKYHRRSQR